MMMVHVTRLFLVLVVAVVVLPTGHAGRHRSERAALTPRWFRGFPHVLQFFRPHNKPIEYHNGKAKQKLAGPDKDTTQVCYQADDSFPCECSVVKGEFFIDCRNESLRTTNIVPIFDAEDGGKKVQVERVDLEGNVITELWKGKIVPGHESTLKQLILRRNGIIYIDDGAFSDMSELITLDLSFNRLTHLPKSAFAGGQGLDWKLQNLYLNNNLLIKVDDHAFQVLTMLRKLVLDNNIGLVLTSDTFDSMRELKELSLDGCGLEDLPPRVFEKLYNLEYLSMRENPLPVVPAPVKALRSLYALDLSATFISELTHDVLSGAYHLEQLIMRDMPYFWAIEECAFCGLPHLKKVVFFNCSRLYYVDPYVFGSIETARVNTAVELVDFENCNISSLSGDMLAWSQVNLLKLGGNPFHCDCNLSWMTNQDIDYSSGDMTPVCASPSHLQGRPLNVLRQCELCDSSFVHGSFRFGRLSVGLALVLLALVALLVTWYTCSIRGRDGKGFRLLRNVSGDRNLTIKEDKIAFANDDYNQSPSDLGRKDKTLPPAVQV